MLIASSSRMLGSDEQPGDRAVGQPARALPDHRAGGRQLMGGASGGRGGSVGHRGLVLGRVAAAGQPDADRADLPALMA